MTVWFDKARRRWRYQFERAGKRASGYCLDAAGQPATSRRAAIEADRIAQRAHDKAAKAAPAGGEALCPLAVPLAGLLPAWERQADWHAKKTYYIPEIVAFFGAATPVGDIDEQRIAAYVEYSRTRPLRVWAGGPGRDAKAPENARFWRDTGRVRSARTVNLHLNVLRQLLARAGTLRDPATGELLLKRPPPPVKDLKTAKRKPRPVPESVAAELLGRLPQHAFEAMVLTMLFGFRRSEALGLKIANVSFELSGVWLNAHEVKDAEDEFLQGSPEAMAFLERMVAQARARKVDHLVAWKRPRARPELEKWVPVKNCRKTWARALREIGAHYRWHDIRGSFITWVALNMGPVAAQSMARHSSYQTTKLYVSVADDIRRAAAQVVTTRPGLAGIDLGADPQSRTPNPHTPKLTVVKKTA